MTASARGRVQSKLQSTGDVIVVVEQQIMALTSLLRQRFIENEKQNSPRLHGSMTARERDRLGDVDGAADAAVAVGHKGYQRAQQGNERNTHHPPVCRRCGAAGPFLVLSQWNAVADGFRDRG